ncbi:MAG: small ribosomal subunit Rsm22 family protein [Opitutaceae bacterium]
MTWAQLDWPALERLRGKFLQGSATADPYWETAEDLANYDFTYGERIGWKWDHVLRELRLRGWRPSPRPTRGEHSRTVFDWGCGSGIAARRVISFFGAENFDSLTVWDHSPLACDFAAASARHAFPGLQVASATPGLLAADEPLGLLVLSHVLNELPPHALAELRALIARADAVLWVEPGTHAVSRQLGALRDELRAAFRIVAPCTHEHACPMFASGSERHWCHFFAPPPSEIFADPNWVKFGQRAGIDLRSLPYCFVALEKKSAPPFASSSAPAGVPDLSRIIGRVEHFKPYARWLNCDATGLAELELPKRAAPPLFKELERSKAPLVYSWQREGNKVSSGAAAQVAAQPDA